MLQSWRKDGWVTHEILVTALSPKLDLPTLALTFRDLGLGWVLATRDIWTWDCQFRQKCNYTLLFLASDLTFVVERSIRRANKN